MVEEFARTEAERQATVVQRLERDAVVRQAATLRLIEKQAAERQASMMATIRRDVLARQAAMMRKAQLQGEETQCRRPLSGSRIANALTCTESSSVGYREVLMQSNPVAYHSELMQNRSSWLRRYRFPSWMIGDETNISSPILLTASTS